MRGKFVYAGDGKLYVKGVTYGTFRPDEHGAEFHDPDVVEHDFSLMAANGVNTLRTYTVPPEWLLDVAAGHGLYVMVGLPWEQHVAFLDDRLLGASIEERVRAGVRACARHPAVLAYAVGNEIPAAIVRWHGRRRVEEFLKRLVDAARDEDPDGLVTYVNFPSTEYLELPFLDLVAFNVYLEDQTRLELYLARLQNLAGDRPLLMAEIGLDSRRNGVQKQAETLRWQVGSAFASGCAGAFVYAWTDEWHRGGHDIEDWDFGLVDRDRAPKPALAAVRRAFAEIPVPTNGGWPRISVVVCSHNGAQTIRETCQGLVEVDYPDYEVIVVDDGSTDATAAIAADFDFRVISTPNRGLSAARNTGLAAATGEIVVYLDDDATPDRHWLRYLAHTFETTGHDAVGGPNVAPDDDLVASCVARAPGGPIHVLLSDTEAEHIPGCNMAFRTSTLRDLGGFDESFRVAGDDVDICWRLHDAKRTIGFNPAAMVWHRRRDSVRGYLRQQRGYGRAEALLERKWPERYNAAGHVTWAGRIYGHGATVSLLRSRRRINYGTWGTGLFQRIYSPPDTVAGSLPTTPEWILMLICLGGLSLLGLAWLPLFGAVPVLAVALGLTLANAYASSRRAWQGRRASLGERLTTMALHLLQPAARLAGRLGEGLHPWRHSDARRALLPVTRSGQLWSERWRSVEDWMGGVERAVRKDGGSLVRGGPFARWDLEVRGGLLGGARLRIVVEEHGAGRQLLRYRVTPRVMPLTLVLGAVFAALALGAGLHGAWIAFAILAGSALLVVAGGVSEAGTASARLLDALETSREPTASLEEELVERARSARAHDLGPAGGTPGT